jgi:putative ABC transport system permease protein
MCATLALGIGLTTAIFSLGYAFLIRGLPYPESGRLVTLWLTNTAAAAANVSRFNANAGNWIDWRAQSQSFQDIALAKVGTSFNLTGDGEPERVLGALASWNLADVLGVQPLRGRMFSEEETRRDSRVALISYGFWEGRFGRDPDIVGRKIQLNGEPYEVIGVMPQDFRYPSRDIELLAPLFIRPDEMRSQFGFSYRAVGRLKPGVTIAQGQAEATAITRHWAEQFPRASGGGEYGVLAESLLEGSVGQFRTSLYILFGAVGCLLLIACANMGGLLIVRASGRTQEFGIRSALGASRGALLRQTLAEVLPLGAAGGAGGVLVAWWLISALGPWLPPQLQGMGLIGMNGAALGFALVMSLVVVLLAGVLPARMASRAELSAAMQHDSRTIAGSGRARNALVAAQIAVTLVLVFAGGLLARSLAAVMTVDPGFSPQGVLTMHLQTTQAKYPTERQAVDYYDRLLRRVRTIPGVLDAGMISLLPFSELRLVNPVEFEGKPDQGSIGSDGRSVTPGYFAAMGIQVTRGRDFSEQDKEGSQPVAIIDERLARLAFGDDDPLGWRLRFGVITSSTEWLQIIGVVGHIRGEGLETDPRPQLYWPKAQHRPESQQSQDRAALVVRTSGQPASFASAVVEQIHTEDPDQPVYDVRSMQDWVDRSLRSRNLLTALVALFGGSSLLLACLGLYGVVSYATGLRGREFAIRMALGARPGEMRQLVLVHAGRLWLYGSILGLAAVWPVGRALQSLLFGVGRIDAIALGAALTLLFATALIAGSGPARKARRVDPAVTLRTD